MRSGNLQDSILALAAKLPCGVAVADNKPIDDSEGHHAEALQQLKTKVEGEPYCTKASATRTARPDWCCAAQTGATPGVT